MEEEFKKITPELKKQIIKIRDTGLTNMFVFTDVQELAYQLECFELVAFLDNRKNRKIYFEFILHGKES